jgi:hypothetical protein
MIGYYLSNKYEITTVAFPKILSGTKQPQGLGCWASPKPYATDTMAWWIDAAAGIAPCLSELLLLLWRSLHAKTRIVWGSPSVRPAGRRGEGPGGRAGTASDTGVVGSSDHRRRDGTDTDVKGVTSVCLHGVRRVVDAATQARSKICGQVARIMRAPWSLSSPRFSFHSLSNSLRSASVMLLYCITAHVPKRVRTVLY